MNSTETPGGPGIPAGWYDDPSGQGLRWWDGEQWTEHVHSAESAATAPGAEGAAGEKEGAPPRDLVKLRENIRGRGVKGVGVILGAAVLVIVVVALLLSGGSDDGGHSLGPGGGTPGVGAPSAGGPSKKAIREEAKIEKALQNQLGKGKDSSKIAKQARKAEEKALEQADGGNVKKQLEAAEKAAKQALNGTK